jgi:hypothetical protein
MAPVFYLQVNSDAPKCIHCLLTYIIVSNDAIQLQISSIEHYGTDVFTLFYTSLWEDSHQDKARAKCWSYGKNNNIMEIPS